MKGKALRVLFVEDVEQDALLVERELRRGGFDVTYERVDTPESMASALDREAWDLVISDYSMPRFSAPLALELVRRRGLELPFIIVSGTVGEEVAVAALHAGAHDFMAKDKLGRLNSAVERGLREAELRAEQARMEEQLLISDRMASMGTLAAGVAHEINNPLAALVANLEFVRQDLDALIEAAHGEAAGILTRLRSIEEPLRDAKDATERVREIARDLKIFSRSDEGETGAVDLRRVIESTIRMARTEIRHRARLVLDIGGVPPVQGNEGRLGQVFLNLIVNAAHAIPEGRVGSNEIRIVARESEPGKVVTEVRDTGSGIPPEVLHRIFDPFYTSKPKGEGTGLGLSICRRIIAALGGDIAVESRVGEGTSFRITLPVAESGPRQVRSEEGSIEPGRRGRILVVDDEPMLLAALRRILAADHDVVECASAREAIDRILSGESYDAVLCDLMMPELTGMDLYEMMAGVSPELADRVIFMTGGGFTGRARSFLEQVESP
ncbi:MAG TPA: ATP-binding protein, partial [Vulgatibacter sp.]